MGCRACLLAGLLFTATASLALGEGLPEILFAYGPGGPHRALKECAERFRQQHGIRVEVLNANPKHLAERLAAHGDLYFGGAEYMLHDLHRENPGLLDLSSAEFLHPRQIGLIVREDNPLGIKGLEDLARDEIDLLVVELEQMDAFHPPDPDGEHRHHVVYTGRNGIDAWRTRPELDAWITYRSWHVTLGAGDHFIEIPGSDALRHTPVAPTQRTPHRQQVLEFIQYLKSQEARLIFENHGWY